MRQVDLTLRLVKARQALVNELTAPLAEFDLTIRSWKVLIKSGYSTYTQRELSEICEIDKTSMVTIVDNLEARGLVRRNRSATDRRAWNIVLTDDGKELVEMVRPVVDHVESRVLEVIPADERDAFLSGLAKLAALRKAQVEKSSQN